MKRQGITEVVVVDIRGVPGERITRRLKGAIGLYGADQSIWLDSSLEIGGRMAEITFVHPGDHPFQPPLSINQSTQNNKADIISFSSTLSLINTINTFHNVSPTTTI
jgi:hypothetical protein